MYDKFMSQKPVLFLSGTFHNVPLVSSQLYVITKGSRMSKKPRECSGNWWNVVEVSKSVFVSEMSWMTLEELRQMSR